MDPVLHLVRNAIAHGIETPEVRVAAGKTPHGTIQLSAATVGDRVTIEIADDGAGIDVERVLQTARAAGLPVSPGPPTGAALLALICAPGLSTRAESDRAAGRGVGMAVVKAAVEQLSGSLSVDTVPGQGTRFTIQLPITLAITDALITRVGTQTFAIPQGAVREVLEVDPALIRTVEQREIVPHRQAALPLLRLARLFGIAAGPRDRLHVFVAGQDSASRRVRGRPDHRTAGDRRAADRRSPGPRRGRIGRHGSRRRPRRADSRSGRSGPHGATAGGRRPGPPHGTP